jgi:hypothetical protein
MLIATVAAGLFLVLLAAVLFLILLSYVKSDWFNSFLLWMAARIDPRSSPQFDEPPRLPGPDGLRRSTVYVRPRAGARQSFVPGRITGAAAPTPRRARVRRCGGTRVSGTNTAPTRRARLAPFADGALRPRRLEWGAWEGVRRPEGARF